MGMHLVVILDLGTIGDYYYYILYYIIYYYYNIVYIIPYLPKFLQDETFADCRFFNIFAVFILVDPPSILPLFDLLLA